MDGTVFRHVLEALVDEGMAAEAAVPPARVEPAIS
jgi:hypothetical protein